MSGEYDLPAIYCHVYGVFTHTVPVDAYRGAGRPEATFVVERLVDEAARVTGIDPAEIRRRNFVAPDNFPYQTQVALAYDSGNYEGALDKGLEAIGYDDFRKEQAAAREQGRYLGLGLSTYIEACGLAPSAVVGSLWRPGWPVGKRGCARPRHRQSRRSTAAVPATVRATRLPSRKS